MGGTDNIISEWNSEGERINSFVLADDLSISRMIQFNDNLCVSSLRGRAIPSHIIAVGQASKN